MMSLSSPRAAAGAGANGSSRSSDAYGTFFGDEAPIRVAGDSRRRSAGIKQHAAVFRALGVAGLMIFAASYMMMQTSVSSPSPAVPSPVLKGQAELAPVEQETKTLTQNDAEDAIDAALSATEKAFVGAVDTDKIREFHHAYAR